ncbi:MAG: mitochondrial fission ELM1 family protein [Candidatus Omnitrophica bacterium]|nr:mitochondrial fission ELM1 family protein [Candidatus Omnitrophota bacterium]
MTEWMALNLVRGLSAFLQWLPLEPALALGRAAGVLISRFSRRRRIAYVNLKAAFGGRFNAEERKRIARKHFVNLTQNAVEILRFPKLDQHYFETHIEVQGRDRFEKIVERGGGTILVTPHFGNWELSQILSGIAGKPMHVLARQQKYSRLDDFLNELRMSHGSTAIHKGGAVRDLIRTLRKGGLVGALGDLSGGRSGSIVRFLGRKTTAPTGIFQIAKRTHSAILPCFMVRLNGSRHRVFVEEPFPLPDSGDEARDVAESVGGYYRLLESWIQKYPDQWFWMYKRWKYCFTKRVLVLRDERAGHTHQSEAIRREFENLSKSKTLSADYEFVFDSVEVRFKSPLRKKIFFAAAFFIQPFIQGRLEWLRFFFQPASAEAIENAQADIIISTGSNLAPLNLLLKKENLAKSVVMMKPSFPYFPGFFDLCVVPAHDRFRKHSKHIVRTQVTPSPVNEALLESSGKQLRKVVSLNQNGAKRISIFIGGSSKAYRLKPDEFRKWLRTLRTCAEELNLEFLITTSRRTDSEISMILKEELAQHQATKLLVIANEANLDHATYGMLALSDAAVVTEDSISMISEAVGSGKPVLVIKLGNGKLPAKHQRFHRSLESNALVTLADGATFRSKLEILDRLRKENPMERQSQLLREALQKLL